MSGVPAASPRRWRIAVVGAGALGTIVGALLTEQGHDVELVDADERTVRALSSRGARITGFLDLTVPVVAKLPSETEGEYDLMLLLTKQGVTERALRPLLGRLRPDSIVCTLQNGTPEEAVAAIAGPERTLAGNVHFAAIARGPGESQLATELARTRELAFEVGELDGSVTDRVQEVSRILSAIGGAPVTTGITGTKWVKLVINAGYSGMSAALGASFGEVVDDDVAVRAMVHVMDEAIRAGRAHGIEMDRLNDHPVSAFLVEDPTWTEQETVDRLREMIAAFRGSEASMLQDMRRGIPSERDFIPGRVREVARLHGIDVPFNDAVHRLIAEAEERGELPLFAHGRAVFEELLDDRRRDAVGA